MYSLYAVIGNVKIWMTFVLSEQLAAAVVLGCVADRNTNITQNCNTMNLWE